MSSKKLVCFLMVSLVCALIVGEAAHATIIGITGTVSNADGTPVAGAVVKAPGFGSLEVASTTDENGTYRIPYISFANVIIKVGDEITVQVTDPEGNVIEKTHTVTAADISAGEATFNIALISTTVTVTVAPNIFSADTSGTGAVTATVDREGPVTDETVTFTLSPNVGAVTAATNNGDGTYTATYTSGMTAGNVTLTATGTQSKASGTATITINAGPPAAIELSASPATVSSGGQAIITAMVSDSNGNGVGGASLTGSASGTGTVTNFASATAFGSYTATYTAPVVEAEGTETVTVMTGNISAELTLSLTPVPPRDVSILIIEGTVFKVDGAVPAENVNVTVTVGSNAPQMTTTDNDGTYSVTIVNLGGVAASTGDAVSVVVTDAAGVERGRTNFALTNDQLGEGNTATVTQGVTTDIVIPPRSVNILVVEGVVYTDDGASPAENANVTVTVGAHPPQMTTTDKGGNYSVSTIDLLGIAASTGDAVSVVVTDAAGMERGRSDFNLTNIQVGLGDSATVTQNVMTDITLPPKSVNILIVEGVAYKEDGTTPVGEGLDITVTVGANPPQMTQTGSDGSFSATIISLLDIAASTGDAVSIAVADSSGERGTDNFELTNVQLGEADSATVTRQVSTNIGLTSGVLAVVGQVYLKNGDTESVPAMSDLRIGELTVVATNTTRNLTMSRPVDKDGGYSVTFVDLVGTVAETGDALTLEVQDEAGETVGTMAHLLSISDVKAASAAVDIHTTVPAEIRALNITGSVVELDKSPAGAGVEVTITLAMNGHTMDAKVLTDATGGYEYTFVDLLNPVAATGDKLMVEALRMVDQFYGYTEVELRSYELVDRQITVAPAMLIPPKLELGGLSINPHYTGLQDPMLQQLLGTDLAGLAAIIGASLEGLDDDPLTSLLASMSLFLGPILGTLGTLQLELPPAFDPMDENIAQESFGNAITTRPIAWAWPALSAAERQPGRWVNGDQLNLYISGAPNIESVTFTLNGSPTAATSVPAGGSFMYNFQLEEDWTALFVGNMPIFKAVHLMIDGQQPVDMTRDDMGVWSAEVPLTPGATVSYYYMVQLSTPYHDPALDLTITQLPSLDPRNPQVMTAGFMQAVEGLLLSDFSVLEGMRSVFSVPEVNEQQSLWVGTLDLGADGPYQLDVNVSYRGGYQESITGKTFTVDRTPPTAGVALNLDAPGTNAGLYMREDGTYVATGPMPGAASLTVSAQLAAHSEPDGAGYMYQLAPLDAAGNPGMWNPVATPELISYTLEQFIANPTSVLPLTGGAPLEMLIRSAEGGALMGTYGVRAVGIDSLLNMDSSAMAGVVVDFVLPDPDSSMVSLTQVDFDNDGVADQPDGGMTVFSDTTASLIVGVTKRSVHPLTSIAVEYQVAGGAWETIAILDTTMLATAMVGDQHQISWAVGDYAALPDRGGSVMVRTVTTNALNVVDRSMTALAYQRRLAPDVAAVHVEAMDLHPDSGAPRGEITLNAFTQAMTNPISSAIQFEVSRAADDSWQPIGIAQMAETTIVSNVQAAIIEDLVGSIVGGASTAPVAPFYRQWSVVVDTSTLEDTIDYDDPNGVLDPNPWVVRAIATDTAGTGYPAAAGVEDRFSLDNYSPTVITTVANEIETVTPHDTKSYYVSGLLAEDVPDPMLTLTVRTGAYPGVFPGGIQLHVTDTASGSTLGVDTVFEASGNYTYTGNLNLASLPNGTYTLMAAAYAADGTPEERIVAMEITVEVGNFTPPDNFTDPSLDILSIIDTEGDVRTSSEIGMMYPMGFPAHGDKFTFTLTVPNVIASDLDVLIGMGGESARMLGVLTDDGTMVTANADGSHTFEVTLDTSLLQEAHLSLVGTVNKPNGSAPFGLPSIGVDRSGPVVEIVSPVSRHQVTGLPTIQLVYADATGFNPNDMMMESMSMDMEAMPAEDTEAAPAEDMEAVATEDVEAMPAEDTEAMSTEDMEAVPMDMEAMPMKIGYNPVVITLTRLATGEMIPINRSLIHITSAASGELLTQNGNIVYTHDADLAGGAYRIEASMTDVLGNVGTAQPVEFTVQGVKPTVSIASPLVGQVVDPRQPLIVSAALTGNGEITVTEFQINGTDIEGTLADNWLNYTIQPPLVGEDDSILQRGSENTISVKIVDSEGLTAEGAISFAVSLDSTPPVISGPSPQGEITRKIGRVTARVSDNESNITRIQFALDDNPLQDISFSSGMVVEVGKGTEVQGQTNFNFFDAPLGTHSVTIVAESTGGSTTLTWTFTIVAPDTTPPKVVTYSPLGIIRTDRPVLAATVSDESGFKRDGITLILAGVPGNQGSGRRSSPTSTTVTFTPSISVTPGPYTARLTVVDRYNNRTEAEWQFTVELDETPPSITATSPHGIIRSDKPIISVSASDDMSGVDTIEIGVKDNRGAAVNGISQIRSDKTAATFTPTTSLKDGTHTVSVTVTDMSGNKAAGQWQFTVELDTIAPSILITRPSQEHTENRRPIISATYTDNMSGVDVSSVKLMLDGTTVEPDEVSETQVIFTPKYDLTFDQHTVKLEVSDMAPTPNTAVQEWHFFVERVGIADARNYPNPFDHETMIAFRISRQAKITIRVYDFTGRLVATPLSNSLREAGLVEVDWHGETSGGEHLARGVYFCHILMESELEPQSAILKMAIISE